MTRTHPRRRRGLTLVEIAITAAVGSMLFVLIQAVLVQSRREFQAGEEGVQAAEDIQRIVSLLRKDLQGPDLWTQCEYPEEVLVELGWTHGGRDLCTRKRVVERRAQYYSAHQGPMGHATYHVALPRRRTRDSEGLYTWMRCGSGSEWARIPEPPSIRELAATCDVPHPCELVPTTVPDRDPTIWTVGPALWAYHQGSDRLQRWSPEDGFLTLEGIRELEMIPADEWSANLLPTREDPSRYVVLREKFMLRLALVMTRRNRPDVPFETLLTRRPPLPSQDG